MAVFSYNGGGTANYNAQLNPFGGTDTGYQSFITILSPTGTFIKDYALGLADNENSGSLVFDPTTPDIIYG